MMFLRWQRTAPHDRVPRSLPRGRHAAAREVVLASQRGRLLEAMAQCVAEQGYAATTVAQVIARAGVSRKTFYEQFADKRACFLAAWEVGTEILLEQVLAAGERGRRLARARCAPAPTRSSRCSPPSPTSRARSLIEVLSVGEEALARRAEINERFAAVLAETHAQALAEGAELGAGAALGAARRRRRRLGADGRAPAHARRRGPDRARAADRAGPPRAAARRLRRIRSRRFRTRTTR